jgi:Flp pilus assembly protein TadG
MAAVEFAIIGAPLLLMLVEIFQSALFVYNTSRLDAATHAAARQIITGSVQKGGQTAAQFLTNLCSQLPVTIPCGSVIVNLQTFPQASFPGGFYSFVNNTQSAIIVPPLDNTKTSFCPGGSGEYVYALSPAISKAPPPRDIRPANTAGDSSGQRAFRYLPGLQSDAHHRHP